MEASRDLLDKDSAVMPKLCFVPDRLGTNDIGTMVPAGRCGDLGDERQGLGGEAGREKPSRV